MANSKRQKKTKAGQDDVLVWASMLFCLVLLPVIYSTSTIDPVVYPRFTALAAGLLVFGGILFLRKGGLRLQRRVVRNPFIVFLLIYVVLTLVSMIQAVNPAEGLTDLFKLILFMLLFLFFAHQLGTVPANRQVVLKSMVIYSFISLAAGIYQFLTLEVTLDDPNVLSRSGA